MLKSERENWWKSGVTTDRARAMAVAALTDCQNPTL